MEVFFSKRHLLLLAKVSSYCKQLLVRLVAKYLFNNIKNVAMANEWRQMRCICMWFYDVSHNIAKHEVRMHRKIQLFKHQKTTKRGKQLLFYTKSIKHYFRSSNHSCF